MLIAKNLSKIYRFREKKNFFSVGEPKEVVAVKDVSLEIMPGQIIGLLGINGAGKTTTIKMLSSLLEPTSGSIIIDDIDVLRQPKEIKKIVNVITGGERNIYWRLTARENLEYFSSLYNLPQKARLARINELLELIDLKGFDDIPVERYSKGMKQRLQIARGLINDPKYLFLDEPTLGLDIGVAKELRNYIKRLAQNEKKGILLTTHYISEIEELCDYVYVINNGSLIMTGTPSDIIKNARVGVKIYIHVSEILYDMRRKLEDLSKVYNAEISFKNEDSNVTISINALENITVPFIKALMDANVNIQHFNITKPSLEDALIKFSLGGNGNEVFISNY
ncbi:hypothetical protein CCS79_14105 [Clostridium diolis]|uniref:ABC transporter ATP-binding protein n=1 Tax=Clostridium diolis TaxID=223919 RepID=UPI000B3FD69B|nr:ABC transporter ATP-binding protein [Clostridium diolis]OVE67257.1 hypothetical protein CCS79_14105 [Clostridium diolis]